MLTSVRRDILDHSISGDKIFGGTINWIDGLYSDRLVVPHTGTAGIGTINGESFIIGASRAIGGLYSTTVAASTFLGLKNSTGTSYIMYTQRTGDGAELRIRDHNGTTRINLNTATQLSTYLDKVIVGQLYPLDASVLFETPSAKIPTLTWVTCYGTTSYLGSAYAKDNESSDIALADLIEWVYFLNDFLVDGSNIAEPWNTLTAMTSAEAGQLLNINSTVISEDNWSHLPSLDQDVGVSDEPTFEGIHIGDIAVGETGAANLLTSYKEWIGEDVNVTLNNFGPDLISVAAKMDVVKCGSLVTINVYLSGSPSIELANAGGSPLVGYVVIPVDDTIFSSILISDAASAPGIASGYYLLNEATPVQCYMTPPFESAPQVFISNITGSTFSVAAGESLYLRSFSISYIVK
jgi:hypothetical protein